MPSLGIAIVRQYERGVVFRLGQVRNVREPGLRFMIPLVASPRTRSRCNCATSRYSARSRLNAWCR
ncbi:SPFH domain-containing protein [Nonomuraea sp. NPDC048916]|uniref:SPFH domain-containing protein n=1 Tax=Nonomuraea sp. NPDC048916 TaxID=3154232 RepID=UPI00340DFD42